MKWVLFVFVGLLVVITVMAVIGSLLPKGHVASRMARFRATPDSVWALITGEPMWRPGVRGFERVSEEGGRRVWREVDSHGRAITFEAIEEVPPKRLVTRIADTNLPFGGGWTFEIMPETAGTILRITERGEVYNPIFRFMSRFLFGQATSLEQYLKAMARKFGEEVRIEN